MTGADDPFYCKYDEYDYVISLGGNCATASQLVHRGKRLKKRQAGCACMLFRRFGRYT